jgi:hypothetical protein
VLLHIACNEVRCAHPNKNITPHSFSNMTGQKTMMQGFFYVETKDTTLFVAVIFGYQNY